MTKFQKFFYELLAVQRYTKEHKHLIKKTLQDSTDNNRTVSVNQVLRYTSSLGRGKATKFARQLSVVYGVLKPFIQDDRIVTSRTDAIDLSELVNTYRSVVMNNKKLRRTISSKI